MSGQRKRKWQGGNGATERDGEEGVVRGNQTLPVADLPPGFDGVPLDGAQYLAVVRQESETVPSVCSVPNPYARVENVPLSGAKTSWNRESTSSAAMPSLEWRKRFLDRFSNMRESLSNRPQRPLPPTLDRIPRGRSGKAWYKFLHGCDLLDEVEYDSDQGGGEDDEDIQGQDVAREDPSSFSCREPSGALLHQFSTSQTISLLSVMPYWFTQAHVSPTESEGQAIDPFHSRWLFSLLAHLEEQLVGDDVSVLRTLARACLACIIQSRIVKRAHGQEEDLESELGAWMIVCAVAGIWGQHDLWEDGQLELEQCGRMQHPNA